MWLFWPPSPSWESCCKVISARRAFRVSPPLTTGPPEFERVYRAQVNCSEYFPLFLATLWVAGVFFHEGLGAGQGRTHRSPPRPRGVLTRASRRGGGPVRPGLPVRAPPLLPGLRALGAAQAGPAVRERARALAAGGAGGARPARALPPRRAAPTASDAAARGLRRRRPARRPEEKSRRLQEHGEGCSPPLPSL
ncbi:leukotriene C4 synthase isoform X3 [Lemur catta]|uniref:leukotriene C4 synthase isoform X3 n=1 Tax=Lemur catta TaxID=9447 RepID=UPI001E26BA9D|nr:leukotriene C4 synthase isoform X3 [Lemur catta]